jgi:hypothetical protein
MVLIIDSSFLFLLFPLIIISATSTTASYPEAIADIITTSRDHEIPPIITTTNLIIPLMTTIVTEGEHFMFNLWMHKVYSGQFYRIGQYPLTQQQGNAIQS